jgi:hypothetical protein
MAPGVAWVEVAPDGAADAPEPAAVAARVPDGPPVALNGSSAVVWRCALGGGSTEDVVARVVEATGQDRETVTAPVQRFLQDLLGRGLLVRD